MARPTTSQLARARWRYEVTSHDILPSFLDELQNVTRKFCQLPIEEKQKCRKLKNGEYQVEGYGNDYVMSEDQIIDWNDHLNFIVQPEDIRKLEYWPENPITFREMAHD
ncbi:uncharacterized protein A4U43_C08F10410 [Asparagus officinalis]|nr:uncharacterized protein A4U43_C08F10410 [Asparagus officinalis]